MSAPTTVKRLRAPYEFATAGNYPAGALPWSGNPSVVAPADSVLAAGNIPDTPVDAPTVNYLEQIRADAATVQSHAALSRWSQATGASGNDTIQFLLSLYPPGSVGLQVRRQAALAIIGNKFATSHAYVGLSADGQNFRGGLQLDLGFADFSAIAADDFGVMFGGLTGVATCKSVQFDSTPTVATFTPGNSNQVEAAHYSAGHYLIAAAGAMYSSTALGGTWASNSIGSVGDTVQSIVNNSCVRAGTVATVLILAKTVASNGHRQVLRSTDDGVTWALGRDFGAVAINACWSPAWGLFVVINTTNSELWTSPDGAAWTKQKTAATLATVAGGEAQIAACGFCIAAIVNHTAVSGRFLHGVAYTFDLGATWQEAYFGDLFTGSDLAIIKLISANGRLYALDAKTVYSSGALESPPALYTGV